MSEIIVSARGLSRQYGPGTAVLREIDLDLIRGEWTVLMGPSGSGKTTLLNLLSGLDTPSSGTVTVAGESLHSMSPAGQARFRRETIGLVFQQYHLIPYLTALENVMLAQHFHSVPDEAEARAALERVGLGHRLTHRPSQLSGGEQQRVCVARALVNEPAVIYADEPTGNLDEASAAAVLELFAQICRQGCTVVMVTHNPEIGRLGDRLIQIRDGRIVTDLYNNRLAVARE
ncbi:MAG TPA: ABC transporter ATP-binding protein [Symbiobacteriaceae bacterium]|jgi:putative ABC transport system ATP-binding protein